MGKGPALTTLPFQRCSEIDCEKTAVLDSFVLYDFRTGEIYGLKEEYIPAA